MKKHLREILLKKQDGMGTVEIILILVVIIGLIVIFKEPITAIIENIFDKITN